MTVNPNRDLTADYKYYVFDLLSDTLLAEIPFVDVSYSRSLRESGTFSGSIAVTEDTFNLNLYQNTMPGKTALYVTRNNVCVWGGILWSRAYDIVSKNLEVGASEFTSYLYKRVVWKTWANAYQASITVSGGIANVSLDFAKYDFKPGMPVYLDWGSDRPLYQGYYTVLNSPPPGLTSDGRSTFSVSATYVNKKGATKTVPNMFVEGEATVEVRQDTYDYARDLLTELKTDLFDFDFPNDEIRPGIDVFNELESYSRSGNIATLRTKQPHTLVAGQKISVTDVDSGFDNLEAIVLSTPTNLTLTYANPGPNVSTQTDSERSVSITHFQRAKNITTITTSSAHGFSVGDIVYIDELNSSVDGYHTVYTVGLPTASSFQIINIGKKLGFSAAGNPAASATVAPAITYATWGEYVNNGDLGIEYSTELPSQKRQQNKTIRGFRLQSVGEVLEEYSNVPDGFEYRIDCTYDPISKKFKRTFVFLPLLPSGLFDYYEANPGVTQVAPPSAWGADKIVFDYPGNVLNAGLEENAKDAATRFWVQGDDPDLSQEASQPYSGAASNVFLELGWPILEEVEKIDKVNDENILHNYAERFLAESLPPIANFSLSVNGSMKPELGSYNPGDWCSIVIDDAFLANSPIGYLELDGAFLRKIDAYDVTVPNNPTFPEEITLQLVTEDEVFKRVNPTP
jgi:hypothetical protein